MSVDLVTVPREQLERIERTLADQARRIGDLEAVVAGAAAPDQDPVAADHLQWRERMRQRELVRRQQNAEAKR